VSYSFKNGITLFALADLPMYQYMRGLQVASQFQITGGMSYRFFVKKKKEEKIIDEGTPVVASGAQEKTFKVWGNCEMCEEKIESTVSGIQGVSFADWKLETLMLTVHYNEDIISPDDIKKKLAKIGYDSETHKATEKAYDKLHSCCKYERP
jgi:periplasmic mercuric ion binding protein